VIKLDAGGDARAAAQVAQSKATSGIRAIQGKLTTAAMSYPSHDNAAVDDDLNVFTDIGRLGPSQLAILKGQGAP